MTKNNILVGMEVVPAVEEVRRGNWLHSVWICITITLVLRSTIAYGQTPATLTDMGAALPTPGTYDIFQLSTSGQASMPDGLNYYTDDQSSYHNGEPGQTFTTLNGPPGYLINSLTVKTGGGTTSGTGNPQNYLLHIYSVSGTTASLLATYSATNFAFTDGDWLKWSGFSLPLSSGAVYAFSFGKATSAVGGWEAIENAGGNLYAGGEVGLLPVAGGTINFGSSHNYDAVFDIGLASTGSPTVAVITNNLATAIQTTSAVLNGKIVYTGGSTPQVTMYYGTSDGGTNAAAWSTNIALGPQTGNFNATVTGLKTNTTYFFTGWASNNVGVAWATPSKSFTTPIAFLPIVTNLSATGVAAAFATLNGQVLINGNEWPTTTIYYGTSDGGQSAAAWKNQISLGAQPGVFGVQAAGLTPNTTYYFTSFVSNSVGVTWAGPSKSFTTLTTARVQVLTYHYDNTRQGQNTNETLLTLANVNVTNFGKLFSYPVDGYVYAQPLIMTNVNVPGKGVRDIVFVATMHDSVYAFDANSNIDSNGGLLWMTNLGISSPSPSLEYGARYHPGVGNLDVVPEEGAAGAPVVDPASGTIYVDAFTREVVAGISTNYFHRIHALNITNGNERPYSPVVVTASAPGKGVNGNGTTVTFSAVQHMQRPALTLAGGILYVCYGSHDDTDPYHGWVLGYNATNLTLSTNYIFNTTPNATVAAFGANAGEGALWMGGNGLSVDANTNLYFETGNGSFSANTNGGDYADSFVKLSTISNKLAVADYFTPYNQLSLQNSDSDLGSGGPLLLPDSAGSSAHPHLIVGAGKEGKIYLIDRDHMGHYNGTDGINGSDTNVVQELPGAIGGVWSSPAYWNNLIFYQGNGDVMKAFTITNGTLVATPASRSSTTFGFPGATPAISANGINNGIAWDIQADAYLSSGPAVLHAYNATNLAIELYNSSQNLTRDNPGGAVKMTPPVIAGGKVYVGAEYAMSVYGSAIFLPSPNIYPVGGTYTNSVIIGLTDSTAGVSIYYTVDGTTPTTSSPLYTGPFTLTNNALVQAIAAAAGTVNSGVTGASFINSASLGNGAGLLGQYWTNTTSVAFTNNAFAKLPTLTRTDPTINFIWSTAGPDPKIGQTNFTARWTGCVQPQFNETYTFYATADDGVRLWVNGQLLANGWVDESATIYSNSIILKAQQLYNIRMDYYQGGGNAEAMLAWSSPSTPQSIVPQTQLYPFTNPPPAVVLTSPTAGATSFTASASVTISAEADALYNPISTVNFYANNTFLGGVSDLPYTLTATGLTTGSYALTAVAVDSTGLNTTSAPVNITVTNGSGQPYGLTSKATSPAFFNMPTTFNGPLPALLSQTGVFSNTPGMTPTNGLIPYIPNTPLWSDGALKTRYLAVPHGNGSFTPNEQIAFALTGAWTFPAGTVFVKTFELNTDTTNPNVRHRLETRLLVRDINGAVYGVTYKWRPDNTDADLLDTSLSENISITNATGISTQTWYYPSPSDCLMCHTPVANYVLGVNTRQLNGNESYPATGVTDNQLRTFNRLGLFNPAFDETAISNMEKLSALTNLTASLEERARSYLDANCAQCHQPGGPAAHASFDARYDTPLASQNLVNAIAQSDLGYDHAEIIAPKDIWRSMIYRRLNTTNSTYRMPPLARLLIDTNAVQVITDWINSLSGTPALAPPTITPNGGSNIGSVKITLQSPNTNAAIYYTLDGALPTTNSFLYSGPFNLFTNTIVSASAFETNFNNSVAASAVFFVQPIYLTTSGFLTNQQFQISLVGGTGSNYILQATTDFATWTSISTNTLLTNPINLLDSHATNYPYRFYRVLQQ